MPIATVPPPPPPPPPADMHDTAPIAQIDEDEAGLETDPALAARAEQIGSLIAKGELEAAIAEMERLKEPGARPARPKRSRPSLSLPKLALLDPDRWRQAWSRLDLERLARLRPAWTRSQGARRVWQPLAARPWLLGAAVLALALVVLLLMRRGGEPAGDEALETATVPAPAPPAAATALPAPGPRGSVRVRPAPWGELVEVVDGDGYLQPLPEETSAPLRLELAPGRYRLTVLHPDAEAPASCEVEVSLEQPAECAPILARSSVTDYFRAAGWWR